MKLIGSKMEKDFRIELINSSESLEDETCKLRQALVSEGHCIKNAYVLHWTPEQTEDIYVVLINGSFLLHIEIDKFNSSVRPTFDRQEINDYSHGLSRMHQVQLAVALDLANKKHNQALNRTS